MVNFRKLRSPAEVQAERDARKLRVVFTASRDWLWRPPVQAMLRRLTAAGCDRIAHGAARGGDTVVAEEAVPYANGGQLHVQPYPVTPEEWRVSKAAGINRNHDMLFREEPHLVVALPLAASVGTWHCAVAGASHGATMVCLLGVREAIAKSAQEWGIAGEDRATQVCAWVQEEVRKTITKSRGILSWPDITMPDPSKAWALLTSRYLERDRRTQAGIDALLAD